MLRKIDWKPSEDKVEKKSGAWIGKYTSYGDRLILLTSCLSNVPFYMTSFFPLPKGTCKRMDFFRKRLFWQEVEGKKKYHLVNWQQVCQPKDQGGLGVLDLNIMNICLLCKWIWKIENEEGLWQQLIRSKYLHTYSLAHVKLKLSHSHFWSGLLKVRDLFSAFVEKSLVMGRELGSGRIAGWGIKPWMKLSLDFITYRIVKR